MTSIRIACCAFAASALFLSGMLGHALLAPAALPSAQAATVSGQGNVQAVTARVQNGEDCLVVLSGDSLIAYRTNTGSKIIEQIAARKLGGGDEPAPGGRPRGK